MLSGRALNFYYESLTSKGLTFGEMKNAIQTAFETHSRKQEYLSEWRATSMQSIRKEFPKEDLPSCFDKLVDRITLIHRALSSSWNDIQDRRGQLLVACKGVPECNFAQYDPAPSFEGVVAQLRNAIYTNIQLQSTDQFPTFSQSNEQYDDYHDHDHWWTDRRYGGNSRGRNRSQPGRSRGRGGRNDFRYRSVRPGGFQQRSRPPRASNFPKRCYICKKEGCWSTNHSEEEYRQAFDTYKHQASQYVSEMPTIADFQA